MGQNSTLTRSPTRERVVRSAPFGAPHVFVLVVIDGPDLESSFKIKASQTTLGRGEEAELRFQDDEISKKHCTLRCDAGRCHLIDLKSLNGTTVNGRSLRPGVSERLRHLDEIRIGSTRLLFLAGRSAASPVRVDAAPGTKE